MSDFPQDQHALIVAGANGMAQLLSMIGYSGGTFTVCNGHEEDKRHNFHRISIGFIEGRDSAIALVMSMIRFTMDAAADQKDKEVNRACAEALAIFTEAFPTIGFKGDAHI